MKETLSPALAALSSAAAGGQFSSGPSGQLVMQNHIEQRPVYLDAAVVFDESQLPKSDS